MEQEYKIPLNTAILINLNIMLSSGIFLNTITIAKFSGGLSPLNYLIVGLLMLPIISCMAQLIKMYPLGSFYLYGAKQISPALGFLSSWSYFTGKLASSAIMIHFAMWLIKNSLPIFNNIDIWYMDICIVALFASLNMFKMKAGSTIQKSFMFFKSIPIIFIILVGFLFFTGSNFEAQYIMWSGVPLSLPFVVYAFSGFEASCSLSQHIENSKENGPKAVFYSFAIAVLSAILYQTSFFGAVGAKLLSAASNFESFAIFFSNIFGAESMLGKLKVLPQLAIASSALGGAYGVFFSNQWNLYELAMHNFVFFSDSLTKFNKHKIPYLCTVVEAIICISYVTLFSGSNVILQQIGAFGSMLAYLLSVIALFSTNKSPVILLGLLSSIILLCVGLSSSIQTAATGILVFMGIVMAGLLMFVIKRN